MQLQNGTKVILEGISKKGKERVKKHGNSWIVVKQGKVAFSSDKHILLESSQDKEHRWIKSQGDTDFALSVV